MSCSTSAAIFNIVHCGKWMEDDVRDNGDRRRHERLRLGGEVQFRRVKETPQATPVHDLCAAGCRVGTAVNMLEGERAWVRLPGLESIPSTVRWAKEWVAGVSFDRPMHPAVFRTLLGRMRG